MLKTRPYSLRFCSKALKIAQNRSKRLEIGVFSILLSAWSSLPEPFDRRKCRCAMPMVCGGRLCALPAACWLMDPYDHILPILRERGAHMPYQYLESLKTIFWEILNGGGDDA